MDFVYKDIWRQQLDSWFPKMKSKTKTKTKWIKMTVQHNSNRLVFVANLFFKLSVLCDWFEQFLLLTQIYWEFYTGNWLLFYGFFSVFPTSLFSHFVFAFLFILFRLFFSFFIEKILFPFFLQLKLIRNCLEF